MNKDLLTKELRRDEGVVLHAYEDHLGHTTIGIGRLIDGRKGGGITESEANYLLANDIAKVVKKLEANLPFYKDLDDARKRALCNMCFQMGLHGLLGFKKMLAALEAGDYKEACVQGLDSKWAKEDTPQRAYRVTSMILRGSDYV